MPRKPTGNPPGKPKEPLDDRMWRALAVELEGFDDRLEPWPSSAKPADVARAAGVSHTAIQKRRRGCRFYRSGLFQLLLERELDLPDPDPADSRLPWEVQQDQFLQFWGQLTKAERRGYMLRWVCRWPGWREGKSITSPIDGRAYSTPQTYADHLTEEGAIPWPDSRHQHLRGQPLARVLAD